MHLKNAHAIRSIQDKFRCCGLRSLHDRAWPFKDRTHGDNACELQLGYQSSCFAPWREKQQNTSWMIFAAVIIVFAVKVGLLLHWDSWRNDWTSVTLYRLLSLSFPATELVGWARTQAAGSLITSKFHTREYRTMRMMWMKKHREHSYPSLTRRVGMTGK